MMDALVKLLQGEGYQPAFLPRTGREPPDVYTMEGGRLEWRGPLRQLVDPPADIEVTRGVLPDLRHTETTGKKLGAATDFLGKALACLGMPAIPDLDLGFTGGDAIVFALVDLTSATVAPAALDPLIPRLRLGAIPDEVVRKGRVHIAYEYVYARRLLLYRADKKRFAVDPGGLVGGLLDLGASGKVERENESTIAFSAGEGEPAAFAYRAGRLTNPNGDRWELHLASSRRDGNEGPGSPYVPALGVVLDALPRE
jgi:hypothetical protein